MPEYRRNFVPGGTYFFTIAVHERQPIFASQEARTILRQVFEAERVKRPFDSVAMVLLPDHLHAVWTLPPGDADYSMRWARIKSNFSRVYLESGESEGQTTSSRLRQGERAIWQRRFWEHTCRDEDDLKRCVDYLHWNPVKHGLVGSVGDYPWSTFHRFVRAGEYDPAWGGNVSFPGLIGSGWG
jgi:putative transposase